VTCLLTFPQQLLILCLNFLEGIGLPKSGQQCHFITNAIFFFFVEAVLITK